MYLAISNKGGVKRKVQKEVQGNKTGIVVDNVSGVLTLHPLSDSIANRSLPCLTLYM